MHIALRRAKTAVKEVAKRMGRGFGAKQSHVYVNLKYEGLVGFYQHN